MSQKAKTDVKAVLAKAAVASMLLAVAAVTLPNILCARRSDEPGRTPALTHQNLTGMMPEVLVRAERPPELMAEVVVRPEHPVVVDADRPAGPVPNIY